MLLSDINYFEMNNEISVKYISIADIPETTCQLIEKIDNKPDLVVFVETGAFLIGKTIASYYNIPLKGIKASRSGSQFKKLLFPILKLIPQKIKIWLREKEQYSGHHTKNNQRTVSFAEQQISDERIKSVLLVDDAVDSGYTMLRCREVLLKFYPDAEIKLAALTVFDMSKKIIDIDYCLYEDVILMGPWANDSREHTKFLKEYKMAKQKNEF